MVSSFRYVFRNCSGVPGLWRIRGHIAVAVALASLVALPAAAQDVGPSDCVALCDGDSDGSDGGGSTTSTPGQPSGPTQQELQQQLEMSMQDHNDAGFEAYEAGRYDEAFARFQAALAYVPYDPILLGNALTALQAGAAERAQESVPEAAFAECVGHMQSGIAILHDEQICYPGSSERGARSCGECGRALINDIGYGLPATAGARNYVVQSLAKYQNCVAQLGGTCDSTCGDLLSRRLEAACSAF